MTTLALFLPRRQDAAVSALQPERVVDVRAAALIEARTESREGVSS